MAGVVVVFDFDRTIIDGDSDNWVVTQMGLSDLFNQLRRTLPWNSLMDRMMKELHLQGKTAENIAECLRHAVLDPQIAFAIKSAHAIGCDLRIISDANQFFIEKILEHHALLNCFSKIYTNPTHVDQEGRLRIFPYHDSTTSPHACPRCPPNMCKGQVLDLINASYPDGERQRFIYLGDGGGDYCPTLKLQSCDYVMPRKNYPLWNRIHSDPVLIKAEVHEWSTGEELERNLLNIINTICTKETSNERYWMEKKSEGQVGLHLDEIIESMPLFTKELIAGGVAGGFAKTVVAPLERVKILFQTRRDEFKSIGLIGSVQKIAKTEGIMGFYRGNGASVARIVPYAALHYMAYEEYRRWIILGFPDVGRGPVLDLVAGSIAGGTAVLFTYPLDLVRTKLAYQVSPKMNVQGLLSGEQVYKGIFDCFSKTYKESGVRGLYRGVAPSLYGIFPYAGLKFYFYEEMKRHVPEEHKKNIMVKLVCGSVAGLLGQTFTYPLDVVRRQMQVQRLSVSHNAELKGTMETLAMIARKQGWKQLFSGLSINYLKVVPSVAIGFTVYDIMKSYLGVPSREEAGIEVVTNKTSEHSSSHS
ncbi:hypothetical protein SLE2022_268540 [Rubroshorea leprosula]